MKKLWSGVMVLVVLALMPSLSWSAVEVKLSATYKEASVTVSRSSDKIEEGKPIRFTSRLVVVYQKNDRVVYDEKKDADIDVNSSKTFNYNFKQTTAGSGKYYMIATIRNTKTGAEIFKVAEVISP